MPRPISPRLPQAPARVTLGAAGFRTYISPEGGTLLAYKAMAAYAFPWRFDVTSPAEHKSGYSIEAMQRAIEDNA